MAIYMFHSNSRYFESCPENETFKNRKMHNSGFSTAFSRFSKKIRLRPL